MDLKKFVRDVPDFPKDGILFKDLTTLWKSPEALKEAGKKLLELVDNHQIDVVIGIESRGFVFAPMMAVELQAGFVPVRKKGKLPAQTLQAEYALEYGTDVLEIHTDAIKKGDRVLIHDDVLATGGTAAAVVELVQRMGGEVVQCNFIMELGFLNGRGKLQGVPVAALLDY
ncbi:adenine phosphoribosyltransferase [Sediminicola luteus]|uniref:Adenine phosphoribosyltransferase n=1 Tax=Sediminicola luteus TaxID=319238 RepID=A0A2A4G8N7_9FLAO|nr:adenine phosphoribosyltransferase [Sediminicola luteus]PCE64356.1 adenine phosphoribosyltransferase [Sediminicola luteus]